MISCVDNESDDLGKHTSDGTKSEGQTPAAGSKTGSGTGVAASSNTGGAAAATTTENLSPQLLASGIWRADFGVDNIALVIDDAKNATHLQ